MCLEIRRAIGLFHRVSTFFKWIRTLWPYYCKIVRSCETFDEVIILACHYTYHTLRFEINGLELFKIYWLHEWKLKYNNKSKITPDDVNIFFYSPQLLSLPGRESFRRDVERVKMWLRPYIQAVSGLLSRSANTIFLTWKIMYRPKYLRVTKENTY